MTPNPPMMITQVQSAGILTRSIHSNTDVGCCRRSVSWSCGFFSWVKGMVRFRAAIIGGAPFGPNDVYVRDLSALRNAASVRSAFRRQDA
jgi:hypothetical protein